MRVVVFAVIGYAAGKPVRDQDVTVPLGGSAGSP